MKKLVLALSLCLCLGAAWTAAGQAADAKTLYAKCEGCHGADGAKKAMGVGKPIKGLSAEKVAGDLRGYRSKTFGGGQKAVMEAQVAGMSDADIETLAQYISKF